MTKTSRAFLYRVVAPHYVAGLVVRNFFVVEAAPILRWTIGKRWSQVQIYLITKKKYQADLLR